MKDQPLLNVLQENLNLTEIESYDTVRLRDNIQNSGPAYYFGDRTSQKESYSILIYAEDNKILELFKYYEQFSDCAKIETIDQN
jgi:hypothetical protein